MRILFPDPMKVTNEEGIVAVGGTLDLETLLAAYSQGIFPWPHEGYPLLWFCPPLRGILDFRHLHVSRSLQRLDRKGAWTFTVDQAFQEVIESCARAPRPGQSGTWITPEVIGAYVQLHRAGYAHSAEVWCDSRLVGGIYGVLVRNTFSAESMFYIESNASKWALWKLVTFLKTKGVQWIDVQMITTLTESFGGELISRKEFLKKLSENQGGPPILW